MRLRALETKNTVVRDETGAVIDQYQVREDAEYDGTNPRIAAIADVYPDLFEDAGETPAGKEDDQPVE